MIIETIEDSREVVYRSVNLIWKATHGRIVSIIFDQTQTINVTFNDGEVRAIKIDAPGAVLMKEDVFLRLSRELTISNKDNPIYIDDDTTSAEDELIKDINQPQVEEIVPSTGVDQDNQPREKETVPLTGVDQDNQPQGEEIVPLTGVDQDNQPQGEEIVPLTGVDRDNQPRDKETVPSTGVDRDNQPQEKEIVPSTGVDQSNQSGDKETVSSVQSQDDETSSSASVDQ
ncbi:8715_t:CDS:2, partial [Acaulospora morrowiae]